MPVDQHYCPVALASEILGRPWTPLVLRELLLGSVRFNEIHRGVASMSRSLLSTRLGQLQEAGVVERVQVDGHPEYHLTRAGRELETVIMAMGRWGKRWLRHDLEAGDRLDVGHLMWDVRRRVDPDALPGGRVVVRFRFRDAADDRARFWLVVEDDEVELCLDDPGYAVDLRLETDVGTMVDVWMGDLALGRALRRGRIELRGPRRLRRCLPDALGLSLLAGVERMR